MIRAHFDNIRIAVANILDKDQLGMMKGGYETGVHVMRALEFQCMLDGEVILIINFANTFNSCNRDLLIKLAAAHTPDIAPLVYRLYADETELFVSNGETIISSEGVHQACGFSNMLFTLLIRYVLCRLP